MRYNLLYLFLLCVFNLSCNEKPRTVVSSKKMIEPAYGDINLMQQPDTIHFPLADDTYNEIKSFNYFIDKNVPFISFYDRRSESVNIYNFESRELVKKIRLKNFLKGSTYYKVSVHAFNFDSILVTNLGKLYWIDSSGKVKRNIPFYDRIDAMAFAENSVPAIAKDSTVYMGVRSFVTEKSVPAAKEWKILYSFDLKNKTKELHYNLPPVYGNGLFGRRFLNYSYCYNDKGNFVFSFPADTNIYETNLSGYNVEYYAKSRFQNGPIEPVAKQALLNEEGAKEYALRDSYGAIYFDPHTKRYLRVAKHKLSKQDYESNNVQRNYSVIVFDQDFRIISEFIYKTMFSLDDIFFTPAGGIYVRVNEKDENSLQFVQLSFTGEPANATHLTKK